MTSRLVVYSEGCHKPTGSCQSFAMACLRCDCISNCRPFNWKSLPPPPACPFASMVASIDGPRCFRCVCVRLVVSLRQPLFNHCSQSRWRRVPRARSIHSLVPFRLLGGTVSLQAMGCLFEVIFVTGSLSKGAPAWLTDFSP